MLNRCCGNFGGPGDCRHFLDALKACWMLLFSWRCRQHLQQRGGWAEPLCWGEFRPRLLTRRNYGPWDGCHGAGPGARCGGHQSRHVSPVVHHQRGNGPCGGSVHRPDWPSVLPGVRLHDRGGFQPAQEWQRGRWRYDAGGSFPPTAPHRSAPHDR